MLTHLTPHGFELPAGFAGLLQLEQRNAQRELRAHHERGVEPQCRAEFSDGCFVALLPECVVARAQVPFRRVLCLRCSAWRQRQHGNREGQSHGAARGMRRRMPAWNAVSPKHMHSDSYPGARSRRHDFANSIKPILQDCACGMRTTTMRVYCSEFG